MIRKHKVTSMLLCMLLCLSMIFPMGITAFADTADTLIWNDGDVISESVAISSDTQITVTGTVTVNAEIIISGGNVTLSGGGKLLRGAENTSNSMIVINGGSLEMENITIDGNNVAVGSTSASGLQVTGGSVTINDGTVIRNHRRLYYRDTADPGGSAVLANGPATITMNGGVIQNNQAHRRGGAIYLNNGAVFQMNGGAITGNQASTSSFYSSFYGGGAVYVNEASFYMTGGSITDNKTIADDAVGGGIFITSYGYVDISGGTISGNTAVAGSGIYFNTYSSKGDCALRIGGAANIEDEIFLDDRTSYSTYIDVTSALQNTLKVEVNSTSNGRVIAQGGDYALTEADMQKIQMLDTDLRLILQDNRIELTDTAAQTYTITARAGAGGTVSGGGAVAEGGSVTLTATANEGYTFDGWYDGDNKVCDTAEFVVLNVTADKTYTAQFAENQPESTPAPDPTVDPTPTPESTPAPTPEPAASYLFNTGETSTLLSKISKDGVTTYANTQITGVHFVDLADYDLTDIAFSDYSAAGDGSVKAWMVGTELYIGGYGKIIAGESLSYAFYGGKKIDYITGLDMLDTSNVTDMSNMFENCGRNSAVFTLDLGNKFDTSNVTDMSSMFMYCGRNSTVFTLDLGDRFNTSNVTNMSEMFNYCGDNCPAFTLDLGNKFDTSNVTDMSYMFMYCGLNSNVFKLDLGDHFDTSMVTNMHNMFNSCGENSTAFTLDLGQLFDTSNVTDMSSMFMYCGRNSDVFRLDLGDRFDTSMVTSMYFMFSGCGENSPAFTLDLGDNFDTSKVINMAYMFESCGSSSTEFTLNLGELFDTSNVTKMSYMFYRCGYSSPLFTTLDLSSFKVNANTSLNRFAGDIPVTSFIFGDGWANATLPNPGSSDGAFYTINKLNTTITGATDNLLAYNWAKDNRTLGEPEPATYTITAEAGAGGTVSGGGAVEEGGSVTLTATANEGYTFEGWYEGETKVCSAAEFVVENVTADKTYTAKFAENQPEPTPTPTPEPTPEPTPTPTPDPTPTPEPTPEPTPDPGPVEPSDFDFTSLRTLRTQDITVNHETKTIDINADADTDYITVFVHQLDAIPGGTFWMANYNDHKVVYDSAGSYRIYFLSSPTVSVLANITVGDQTEQYTVNVHFDMSKAVFDFTSLRGENMADIAVDHETNTIDIQAKESAETIILYVSQHDAVYGGTLRMASYLGNKVTYAANGVYTIYSNGKENVSVKTNITINGVTEQYIINITFPAAAPDFGFSTLAGGGIKSVAVDHEAGTIVLDTADDAIAITLPIDQSEAISNGTLRMASYMGNKVVLDAETRIYTIYLRDASTINVKVNITSSGETREYLVTVNFPDIAWGFDTVKAEQVKNVTVDHERQVIDMEVEEDYDNILLYIDQTANAGLPGQIWMKSYNGNDVVYHSNDRTYTITREDQDTVTVAVKITILGETRYYDININFASSGE